MKDYYLGLSTSGHDPALALVNGSGELVFAEATERYVQQKRAWGIPPDHPDHIRSLGQFIDEKSAIQLSRTWSRSKGIPGEEAGQNAFHSTSEIEWMYRLQTRTFEDAGLHVGQYQQKEIGEIYDFDHHLCHAVNACYSAPVSSGLCLVIDGEGDVGSASLYHLKDRVLKRIWRSWGPGSLGTYYSWLTGLCGFDWRIGEAWKVMGLEAFGQPREEIVDLLKKSIHIQSGKPYPPKEVALSEIKKSAEEFMRLPGEDIMKAADLAASGQAVYALWLDEILAHCGKYEEENLILSGGCALNSSYNGTIKSRFGFTNVLVPAAPADDGNAAGSALLSWMKDAGTSQIPMGNMSPYLGTDVNGPGSDRKLKSVENFGGFSSVSNLGERSASEIARKLSEGKIIGVMRDRAEFGPRALGNRSILADPRSPGMKDMINKKVKGREGYRPFAPVVPEARVSDFFDQAQPSPYMSFTLPWKTDMISQVPAVVHQDGTGRLQTVNETLNPWMHALLTEFEKVSKIPVVLNTSFNVMGKPIVHSVEDAMAVLVTTGLDAVLIDNVLIEK